MNELPIVQVAQVLSETFPEINWFTNEVPQENQTLPSLPVGRIVELSGNYSAYASQNPNLFHTHLQVDVWVEDIAELKKYYMAMDKVMRDGGVQCEYSEQTYDKDLEGARRIIKRYTISQRVL